MDEPITENEVPPTPNVKLHRSTSRKVFGGVAGGISERFDVDANVVRVVFVVLSFLWGLGLVIYLAMWAIIPRSQNASADDASEEELDPTRTRWLRYALPLGVLVIFLMLITTFHGSSRHFGWGVGPGGWRFDKGLVLFWLVFLVALAIIALRPSSRRFSFRRFLAISFLSVISFFIFVVGVFLLVVQIIGVPLEGGSGVKSWSPTSIAQLQRNYHGAFGQSTLDLRHVPFTSGTWSITATEGVGMLIVDLPPNVVVSLRTHVGIGDVSHSEDIPLNSSAVSSATRTKPANLYLNLQVGIGQIQVRHFTR